jgi:hypothetical protein
MAGAQRATTLRHIQHLCAEGSFTGLTNTQLLSLFALLLSRFALRRDEAAFAALVVRHGPMVLTARRDCSSTGEIPLADCYVLPGRSDTRTGRRSTAASRPRGGDWREPASVSVCAWLTEAWHRPPRSGTCPRSSAAKKPAQSRFPPTMRERRS